MVAERQQRSDAELVRAASNEDATAFGELFERWFDRVFDVARNIVRNDDTAAEVAQDVFLTTWQRLDQLDDPERFGGWLLRASRNRALNRLEKERRANPLDGDIVTGMHEGQHGRRADRDDPVGSNRLLETEAISDARDQQSLVWGAAAALGPRDSSLLDLQLRHQLSPAEIADELDLTANNAHQLLFRLRGKLGEAVTNHQLWRGGSPRCAELLALVDGDPFDQSTNKVVQRHSTRCEVCGTERKRVVDPTKLFAAVPIAIAPAFLRDNAAAALAAQGVPVSGSTNNTPTNNTPTNNTPGSGNPPGAGTPSDSTSGTAASGSLHRQRRRLGLLAAVAVIVIFAVLLWPRPTADLELVTGPTSSDPAADSSGEPEPPIAFPSTTAEPSVTGSTTSAPDATPPPTPQPEVTAPPREPVPDPDPDPAPPTDPEPEPEPEPQPPPVIVRFTLSTPGGAIFCPDSTHSARTARWFTEQSTGVTITTPNGSTPFDPSGSHTFCAPAGSIITLTATGPGGTATDAATVT